VINRKRKWFAGLLVGATLAVAACGGDDDGGSGSDTTVAAGTDTTAAGTDSTDSTDTTTAGTDTTEATEGGDSGSTVAQGPVGSTDPDAEPVDGGVLNFAVYAETSGLDPTVSTGSGVAGGIELAAIYDVLMRYDGETNEYVPQLAESLTPNADSSVWTLKLRPDVTFTDGTPLNAEAVQTSLQRFIDRKSRYAPQVAAIASYASPDPLTLEMTLTEPWTGFPFVLASSPGLVVSPTAVAEKGDDEFNRAPVGAGPFMLERYAPGEEIVLTRNPDYWNGAPHLEGLRFVPSAGAQGVLDGMGTGELQAGFIREALVVKNAIDDGLAGILTVQNAGGLVLMNQGRNGATPPTADVRVRKAIALAIDPEILDERADQGAGYPTKDVFGPTSRWHGTESTLTYDPDEAKRLVEEVKAETGWDGSISYKCSNSPTRINLSIALGAMLDSVGFKTTVDNSYTLADLIRVVQVEGNYELSCWGFNVLDGAPYQGLSLHLLSTSPTNASAFKNPEYDALVAQLKTSPDDATTQQILDELQVFWDENVPAAIFTSTPELVAWNDNVHGITSTVNSIVLFDQAFLAD
jgi:peptide/nickel transport system substrate-binding protein